MTLQVKEIRLGGGVDGTSPSSHMPPGRLRIGINVEAKPGGGYRRILGYPKFDTNQISGAGEIRGIHYFNGKVYAFRNATGNATCSMWSSSGSGWTEEKSGLTPNGKYRLITADFAGTKRMYGVSGVHQAFQWSGGTWTDITSALPNDKPQHLAVYRKHLFLSEDDRVVNSSLGDPLTYAALTGAADMILPEHVTGLVNLPNGAIGMFTASGIHILSGTSTSDFIAGNLKEYGNQAGAIADTIQPMGSQLRFADSRGITDFGASQASSDFYDSIISHDMDKAILNDWHKAISSTVVRAKNQYRLFFSDGTGLVLVFRGNEVMITRIIFPNIVRCVVNAEDSLGREVIYFGSDDGYIYQMESGDNFNGAAITAHAELAMTDLGTPSRVKRFRRARFDVSSDGNSNLRAYPKFYIGSQGLTTPDQLTPNFSTESTLLGDTTGLLGTVPLGGAPVEEGTILLDGSGEYVSIRFYSSSTSGLPWELDGVTYEYLMGRQRRNS